MKYTFLSVIAVAAVALSLVSCGTDSSVKIKATEEQLKTLEEIENIYVGQDSLTPIDSIHVQDSVNSDTVLNNKLSKE